MFDALLPMSDYLIAAQAIHPRALATEEIERIARQTGYSGPIEQIAAVDVALQRASEVVGPGGMICTTGSMFLVGEMRTFCGLPPGHVIHAVQSSLAAVRNPGDECE
jgi:folylpolyglutamate synthase/dihydropteroate synthase